MAGSRHTQLEDGVKRTTGENRSLYFPGRMALPSLDDYLGTLSHLKQIKDIAEIGRVGYTCDLLSAKKA
jgi:hypothetical protein